MVDWVPMAEITHRTRLLVDVKLPCGCAIIFDFEHAAERTILSEADGYPLFIEAAGGGYWESILWHPGEISETCHNEDGVCTLFYRGGQKFPTEYRKAYLGALTYVGTKGAVK